MEGGREGGGGGHGVQRRGAEAEPRGRRKGEGWAERKAWGERVATETQESWQRTRGAGHRGAQPLPAASPGG